MLEFIGAPFIWSLKRQVASGPVTAEASVGAIHIRGFFRMLLICSIDVPSPCDTMPPQPFLPER